VFEKEHQDVLFEHPLQGGGFVGTGIFTIKY